MRISDAVLIGILIGIGVHHVHIRHGPRASVIARMRVVDSDGAICSYVPAAVVATRA